MPLTCAWHTPDHATPHHTYRARRRRRERAPIALHVHGRLRRCRFTNPKSGHAKSRFYVSVAVALVPSAMRISRAAPRSVCFRGSLFCLKWCVCAEVGVCVCVCVLEPQCECEISVRALALARVSRFHSWPPYSDRDLTPNRFIKSDFYFLILTCKISRGAKIVFNDSWCVCLICGKIKVSKHFALTHTHRTRVLWQSGDPENPPAGEDLVLFHTYLRLLKQILSLQCGVCSVWEGVNAT